VRAVTIVRNDAHQAAARPVAALSSIEYRDAHVDVVNGSEEGMQRCRAIGQAPRSVRVVGWPARPRTSGCIDSTAR
jgi:hypothetical protein